MKYNMKELTCSNWCIYTVSGKKRLHYSVHYFNKIYIHNLLTGIIHFSKILDNIFTQLYHIYVYFHNF